MKDFSREVPFDPGYQKISFSFAEQITYIANNYNNVKIPHQKKFILTRIEPEILKLINKSSAFYLGCMFWGGFISQKFKDAPKKITGNNTDGLTPEEIKKLDCSAEPKLILDYIKDFDRDCKYFLKRPAKISDLIPQVLNSYIEFAKINNNFVGIKETKDIKLPNAIKHFEKLSDKQLDNLCEKIYEVIDSNSIETLLDLNFHKI